MAAKRFPTSRDAELAPTLDIVLEFVVDGVVEDHEFSARPRMTYSDVVGLLRHQEDGAKIMPFLDRLIRRSLLDDDGTPAKWKPTVVDGGFDGPDGRHRATADLPQVEAFEAGSSRRRWISLLESDDATVEIEQVMAIFEYLTAEAGANRPTSKSSP